MSWIKSDDQIKSGDLKCLSHNMANKKKKKKKLVTKNSATAILTKQKSETYDISGWIIWPFSHTALLFAEQ